MKIFAIRDETDSRQRNLGYLLYYEIEKQFYIELPDKANPWTTPLLLSSFARKGETTISPYWSKIWVQQRILPADRQNIGQVLRENDLKSYDEYSLLMLSMGHCAQDDYYLVPINESELPKAISKRFLRKIDDVVPLEDYTLLVFFHDGTIKRTSLKAYFEENAQFSILLKRESLFSAVRVQAGGYGVSWDVNLNISNKVLYKTGKTVPVSKSEFITFVIQGVVNSIEAAELLGCSRQNIDDLTKRGKLCPIKTSGKNTLYLKAEILKRLWQ